jgi:hypothetical protein
MKKGVIVSIALIAAMMLAACASTKTTPSPVPTNGATPTSTASPTPTDKPATPTEVPATPTPTFTPTPTKVSATPTPTLSPTPTEVPVPTTNLEPTPITSGTEKEIFLSNFAPMSQKGLYATQKMYIKAELYSSLKSMFKFGDTLFVCPGGYGTVLWFTKYRLSNLAIVSSLPSISTSTLEYHDDECLIVSDGQDVTTLCIYDQDFKAVKKITLADFSFGSVLNYDKSGNKLLLTGNDAICEYDLQTDTLKELLLFSQIDLEGYAIEYVDIYHVPSDNEVCIYVEYNTPDMVGMGIPAGGVEYNYNTATGELSKLPSHPGLGYVDEANARYSFFEPGGDRSAVSLCYGRPQSINIYDKDLKIIRTITMADSGYTTYYLSVDWANNVVIYYDVDDKRCLCYSIETGELISGIYLTATPIDYADGLMFFSGTFEENGKTRDVTYVWDYLNGEVPAEPAIPTGEREIKQRFELEDTVVTIEVPVDTEKDDFFFVAYEKKTDKEIKSIYFENYIEWSDGLEAPLITKGKSTVILDNLDPFTGGSRFYSCTHHFYFYDSMLNELGSFEVKGSRRLNSSSYDEENGIFSFEFQPDFNTTVIYEYNIKTGELKKHDK